MKALRGIGYAKEEMCAHGFRSAASSMLNESKLFHAGRDERQLAHVESNSTRRAYARSDFWDERVEMGTSGGPTAVTKCAPMLELRAPRETVRDDVAKCCRAVQTRTQTRRHVYKTAPRRTLVETSSRGDEFGPVSFDAQSGLWQRPPANDKTSKINRHAPRAGRSFVVMSNIQEQIHRIRRRGRRRA